MLARLSLIFFLLHGTGSAWAIPYSIQSVGKSHMLADYVTYFVDSTGLPLDAVLQQPFVKSIDPGHYANQEAVFWMRIELSNETLNNQFVLTIDQWNEVDFYVYDGNTWLRTSSGTNTPVEARPISLHRLISYPLVIGTDEVKVVLVRTKITQPLMRYYAKQFSFLSKVQLQEASYAYELYIGNQLLVMFILGIVTILFVYNFSLFFVDYQLTSLFLSIYFIVIGLVIANIHGITTNYLFPQFEAYEMYMALHLAHLTPVVVGFFLITFFKLDRKNWEAWLIAAFIVFMCLSWFFSMQSNQSLLFFERRYIEYATFLTIIISAMVKKKTGAGIILTAILATIATSHFADFKAVFFSSVPFTQADFPYLIGVLVQVLIFSIASTHRVRILQRGVAQLKEDHRLFVESQNEELKKLVEEKTSALKDALNTLQVQKNELERANTELLSNTDQLEQQAIAIQLLNTELEELVKQRTLALQMALKDLDVFFYRVSHDLRRPLTSILGLNHLISKEDDLQRIRALATMVNKTVLDVDRMLKKLIAISLCYQEDIEKTEIDLREVVSQAVDEMKKQHPGHRFCITADVESVRLESNQFLLRTIIESGLENAVIFGGDGVEIQIKAEVREERLLIMITDNGIGIDPKFIKQAFLMFVRGDERSTGNGLGLYLVKIGTEKLNGSASLKSKIHVITELTLSLPFNEGVGFKN